MSRQVTDRQKRVGPDGQMPSKAERRALGKQAAARARAARRRRKILNQAATVAVVVAIIVGIAALFGAFDSGPASPQASASATGSSPAVVLDPALSTKPTVSAGTGDLTELKVTTLIEGAGEPVVVSQNLAVQYVGAFYKTGEEFDSSWSRGQPFTFVLGEGSVIEGWDRGLVSVRVGSRVQLDIPANLAYGESNTQNKPPGPLRFIIDILSAS